ncbi:RNA polymerase sigma factor [Dysgonomonas sp. ZJ709]|uniref:RNA polymerase sigma factor n=1 Tax=Dysgonomonas sp. ZJ709 TaxID=2709797 RepID=UPI0013EC5D28|nr:RNA polymerase sigma-70 factor [Dysgonomonas sp. ZJ709]
MQNNKTKEDERDLILRLSQDDEEAFHALYVLYRNRIFFTAYNFIKSKEFAEDIYQETFTIIWQKRKYLDPDTSFSSFIFTIVRNKIFDHLRSIRIFKRLPEYLLSQFADTESDTYSHLTTIELQGLIKQSVDKLTVQQRMAFIMNREENLSYREIADNLDISISRVKYLISGALKSIRINLSKYGVLSVLWFLFTAITDLSV